MQHKARVTLLMAGTMVLALLPIGPASAATLTVNTTATNTANDGFCTLREAITASNTDTASGAAAGECIAGSGAPDAINFAIPGPGPHTIAPTAPLPDITQDVVIDGYSQAGASANTLSGFQGLDTVLMIELDGTSAGSGSGLSLDSGTSTIRGLAINSFPDSGIRMDLNVLNRIEGNFIGTDVTGMVDLGNGGSGIGIYGSGGNYIGGITAAARNLVSGNDSYGINIDQDLSTANRVWGNLIGTDATGSGALGNQFVGISLGGGDWNFIGGSTAGEGNVISSNGLGISMFGADSNYVDGNRIGTNAAGTAALSNNGPGILMSGASDNIIGSSGAGNLISGNIGSGIDLMQQLVGFPPTSSVDSTRNIIESNQIGTNAAGTATIGNANYGVVIRNFSTQNRIGGVTAGVGNTISGSAWAGVAVIGSEAVDNPILGNSIYNNGELGIDLAHDQVTVNDTDDPDTGPNDFQNYPVITRVDEVAGTVDGTLNSLPNADFRLEFFSSDTCDASGNGEGRTFLGDTIVTTDAGGDAAFTETLGTAPIAGEEVTATATYLITGTAIETSEFSACLLAGGGAPPPPGPGPGPDPAPSVTPTPTTTPTPGPTEEPAPSAPAQDFGGTTGEVVGGGACAGFTTGSVQQDPDGTGLMIVGTHARDVLLGGNGDDTICALRGDDVAKGAPGDDRIYGHAGNDSLQGKAGNDSLLGNRGNDHVFGNDGADIARGAGGNDTLVGGLRGDDIYGGAGKDTLRGQEGGDSLAGKGDNDDIFGGDGPDSLHGDEGDDLLGGGAGGDDLNGGPGHDTCNPGMGADSVTHCE